MSGSWMLAVCLKIFVSEAQHQDGKPLFEWLLEEAQNIGINGGTAVRAIAGYGRHGKLHEKTFLEAAGEMTVEVEFVLGENQEARLFDVLREKQLSLFYVRTPAECGVTN